MLAYSRTKKQVEGVEYVDLDTLLRESDIVSLHVPQTPATIGMIGRRELSLMKPTAVLINTARGPVVDSQALAAALRSGEIAGAGVDVFETEPPIAADHPLFSVPNVVATPHVAFATAESMVKRAVIVMENIDCYLNGTPRNVIC